MEAGESASSPVYAVYFPGDIARSPRNVFLTLQDAVKFANSPEGKSHGARFNRFGTPKEAMDFFAAGECRTFAASTPSVPAEPVIPHPSVSRIQMNDFKRAIEKGTVEAVSDIIEANPRFLVNTSGDTAAIVMEGFRFNALHIAARHGKADVVEKILQLVTDTAFLADLYGTSEDDTRFRVENIVTSYLNTPDKDNGLRSPILPAFKLSAYAGPFGTQQRAAEFLSQWVGSEKHVKLSDVDKGYERVGRELSTKDKVKWAESWCFLDRFADLRTEEGLSLLNNYLGEVRKKESLSPMQADQLRKKLNFDDEEESPALLTPSEDEDDEGENDEFEDALESVDEVVFNDSLASLADRMGALSLQSPSVASRSEQERYYEFAETSEVIYPFIGYFWFLSLNVNTKEFAIHDIYYAVPSRTPPKDIGEFFTPPATPPPVFLLDHPTKVDNDVMTALLGVSKEQ
ncbi:hypothetical protein ANCCEY_10622 [Ancylostoma ceylanicum]|uniref:ANKLE2 third alpha/beta domain-containing protein n=1 Tax=Ancylostoma ceylanicum TaxID=53326 RepID=A0A0D6LRP0_9BILA|nr:hypothetical protein ANCCEY_10622 [Ancylostoma ceylanicum]